MSSSSPEEEKQPVTGRRRNLALSTLDGVSCSIMVGCGESYLTAFALALGVTGTKAGMLGSLPLFLGSLLQLSSTRMIQALGTPRRWVVLCAFLQACVFVPLMVGALIGSMEFWDIVALIAIYQATGQGAGPAWNTWMESLVPRRLRSRYFARRSRACQIATLVTFLAAGALLRRADEADFPLTAYALFFAVAASARFVCAVLLWAQSEARSSEERFRFVSPFELVRMLRDTARPESSILLYVISLQFVVHMAAPFFTPYMLGPLGMDYGQFVTLVATAYLAKILAYPCLGRLVDRLGTRRFFTLTAFLVVPLSALWVFSSNFYYLVGVQVLSGIFWGSYELVLFLALLETIPKKDLTSVLTTFNGFSAFSQLAGTAVGALLLTSFAERPEAYCLLFAISSLGRGLCFLLLRRLMSRSAPRPGATPPVAAVVMAGGSIDPRRPEGRTGFALDEDELGAAPAR